MDALSLRSHGRTAPVHELLGRGDWRQQPRERHAGAGKPVHGLTQVQPRATSAAHAFERALPQRHPLTEPSPATTSVGFAGAEMGTLNSVCTAPDPSGPWSASSAPPSPVCGSIDENTRCTRCTMLMIGPRASGRISRCAAARSFASNSTAFTTATMASPCWAASVLSARKEGAPSRMRARSSSQHAWRNSRAATRSAWPNSADDTASWIALSSACLFSYICCDSFRLACHSMRQQGAAAAVCGNCLLHPYSSANVAQSKDSGKRSDGQVKKSLLVFVRDLPESPAVCQ